MLYEYGITSLSGVLSSIICHSTYNSLAVVAFNGQKKFQFILKQLSSSPGVKVREISDRDMQRVLNDLKRTRLSRGLIIWLLADPLPSRQQARPATHSKRSRIIRAKDSLVLYKSFNTLWENG
jgi:hypothetical protein